MHIMFTLNTSTNTNINTNTKTNTKHDHQCHPDLSNPNSSAQTFNSHARCR